MALKPCQGCRREVDASARSCPGCGRPKPTKVPPSMTSRLVSAGIMAASIFVWAKACGKAESPGQTENSAGPKSLAYQLLKEPGSSASASSESKFITVPLANLTSDYDGRSVCTCGYVQSWSDPAGDVRVGTIYVSPKKRMPRDDEYVPVSVCWWTEGRRDPLKKWQPVCVRGAFAAPALKDCEVVSACP